MRRLYAKVWRRPLSLPDYVTPLTLVSRTDAAAILGTTREHLRRLAGSGLGPPWTRAYEGKAILYRVADLVIWRAQILSERPTTVGAVWELWCNEGRAIEESTPPPRPRAGRPVGVRVRHWQQRQRAELRQIGRAVV